MADTIRLSIDHGFENNTIGGDLGLKSERSWKPTFFVFWSGQAVSLLGSALVQFALIWWLTLETRENDSERRTTTGGHPQQRRPRGSNPRRRRQRP